MLFLVTITTYSPLKFKSVPTFETIQDIIIISICKTDRMSLYDFFCLNPAKNIFGDVLNIYYSNNIKTWMNNCVCWNYDIPLQWLFFQHQLLFSCMDQRYCASTTNSPAEILCPSLLYYFAACMSLRLTQQHKINLLLCQLC